MHSETIGTTHPVCLERRAAALAVTLALLVPTLSALAQSPPPSQPAPKEQARVPTSYANVHKGPSSGQEVLVRIRDRGHGKIARKLVGLIIEGNAAPAPGSTESGVVYVAAPTITSEYPSPLTSPAEATQ